MTDTATEAPVIAPTSGVRDALGEVRDVDEGKREVLVEIPWEVIDTYRSDFSRDCFDEYLGARLPSMCWQHQKAEPIGRATAHQKGQRANEFVAKFSDFDAVPRARQAFTQIRDGDITDFSFYYDQATAIRHPNVRGAVRFTRARMPEISPVTVGSIPGAKATGVRAAADHAGLAELVKAGVVSEEEARSMLALDGPPPPRERIEVPTTRAAGGDVGSGGERLVGEKGPESVVPPASITDDGLRCAAAVDGSLVQAVALLDNVDVNTLPDGVRDAVGYVIAAGVASEGLREALGMEAPEVAGAASEVAPTGAAPTEADEEGARAADDAELDAMAADTMLRLSARR